MDKIILNSSCNCCNDDENILKITSGNDFSIEIQLTIKEGDEWVSYDLNDVDADSLVVNVVSPTGERYEIDAAISSNKVVGVVDANVLEQYVVYGIEVIWRDDLYDKRAFGPKVFKLVDSSLESTSDPFDYDSNSPYEYNLHINSDIAMLSIGQIPTGDFVTLEMLDEMSYVQQSQLDEASYVTNSALINSLDLLWQDCNSTFIDNLDLHLTLLSYVSSYDLNEMSYVNFTWLHYILDEASYVDHTYLDSYYPSYTYLYSYVGDAIAGVTIDESNLVHKTGDENIGGTKTFANRILGQQGMTISHDILAQGAGVSHNLLGQYIRNGIQTGRISSSQIAVSEIIGPHTNSEYTPEERDAIKFYRNTANNEKDIVLDQMAKIDVNGIYEGTTLLENKYLKIADLPTIPTATSDLTNDSGFITNSDLTTTLNDYALISSVPTDTSDLTNGAGFITNSDLTTTLADYVSQSSLDSMSYIDQDYLDNAAYITLNDIPTIPTVNDATLTIQKNSITVGTFTANQATAATINISVPTTTSDLTNNSGFLTQNDIDSMSYVSYSYLYSYVADVVSDLPYLDMSSYVTYLDWENTNEAIAYAISYLNDNIGQGGGYIPNNVVTSYDGTYIYCLTQQEYDDLEINQQLESGVFYYINDATSNYITQTELDSMSYITLNDIPSIPTDISDLTDSQGLIPTSTSELYNDSGFVASTTVTNIWSGSQSDYNQLTPDANTLYIII